MYSLAYQPFTHSLSLGYLPASTNFPSPFPLVHLARLGSILYCYCSPPIRPILFCFIFFLIKRPGYLHLYYNEVFIYLYKLSRAKYQYILCCCQVLLISTNFTSKHIIGFFKATVSSKLHATDNLTGRELFCGTVMMNHCTYIRSSRLGYHLLFSVSVFKMY